MAPEESHSPAITPQGGRAQVKGVNDLPLSDSTIPALLRDTASRFGSQPAVVFLEQGVRWTWAQFSEEVDRFAAGLASLGLKQGDRLGIWSPNRVEWLVTQFATARISVILVNINPAYRVHELEYALNASGCVALVAAERLRTSNYLEMLQTLAPELATCAPGHLDAKRLLALKSVVRLGDVRTSGMLGYGEVLTRGAAVLDREELDAVSSSLGRHDAINIQFTSGTTGNPKGATLTHHNVVNNARFVAKAMCFSEKDSLAIPVPL